MKQRIRRFQKIVFVTVMSAGLIITAVLALTLQQTAEADDGKNPPQLTLSNLYPALSFVDPIDITNAGDERLFVVERAGVIRVISPTNPGVAPVFLNISNQVADNFEGGLLGLAFSPNYAADGYFYVNYTTGPGLTATRISRFSVDSGNPNAADPASEVVLLQIPQPADNHNGGDLNFGPNDGYLYIGLGDGGTYNFNDHPSQHLDDLLGKMLRIDVNSGGGGAPDCGGGNYTIPADNPFADGPGGNCDEVWAYGLRNPWRFSFDRQTGDMFIGDVGDGTWEEVNFQPASNGGGENYGWPIMEGNDCHTPSSGCDQTGLTLPIYQYSLSGTPCAVVGGFVYRGAKYPNLRGRYLFNDWCTAEIRSLTPDGGGGWTGQILLNDDGGVTYGEDSRGELYLVYLSSGSPILQIQDHSIVTSSLSINKSGPASAHVSEAITHTLVVQNIIFKRQQFCSLLMRFAVGIKIGFCREN